MFFLDRLLQRANNEKLYTIFYSMPGSSFFMSTKVNAHSEYQAQRWFDQNPAFFGYVRRGIKS